MQEHKSEVTAFRQQQALCAQAGQQGLSGLAIVANYEAINARMERGAERILHLVRAGKNEEAIALMSSETWCDGEEKEPAHA